MSFNQNITHFLSQSDAVGQALFALLLIMSISSAGISSWLRRGKAGAAAGKQADSWRFSGMPRRWMR
jgi:hypothetical protein